MAKRIGVLEAEDFPTSDVSRCERYVSKTVARYLVRKALAVQLGGRVIQMRKLRLEEIPQVISIFYDGPIGVGNLLPFSKPDSTGDKLHYEIPRAGDRGMERRHHRRRIRVSHRNLFAKQAIA